MEVNGNFDRDSFTNQCGSMACGLGSVVWILNFSRAHGVLQMAYQRLQQMGGFVKGLFSENERGFARADEVLESVYRGMPLSSCSLWFKSGASRLCNAFMGVVKGL